MISVLFTILTMKNYTDAVLNEIYEIFVNNIEFDGDQITEILNLDAEEINF